MLPTPTSSRFQALRSGLINLFKYEQQEFWFEKGRLLIRGNNGTGKSRVLALQLPFLLDGRIEPRYVEPDRDPARRIDWHLLMDQYRERTGYSWIEFGRRDDAGTEHYVTLGIGLRAVHGGDSNRWFFITEKRMGADFQLVENSHPVSKDRLAEILGTSCLYPTAREYRAEVDRRLFSLGRERYESLIELLIQLRSPQLNKKLEAQPIFDALSDALPPLPEDVVQHVADAFKQLDDLRLQFNALTGLSKSLTTFRASYQSYLQAAIQRLAAEVRTTHSKYEDASRKVIAIERQIAEASDNVANAESELIEARDAFTRAEAHLSTLKDSEDADKAESLNNAAKAAEEAQSQHSAALQRAEIAASKLVKAEAEVASQQSDHDDRLQERDSTWKIATVQAQLAGFHAEHQSLSQWPGDQPGLVKLKVEHQRLAGDHLHRLKQIEEALKDVDDARATLARAQTEEDRLEGIASEHRENADRHHAAAEAALKSLTGEYTDWHQQLRWLKTPAWSELAQSMDDWLETADGRHRVLAGQIMLAGQSEAASISQARTQWQHALDQLFHERDVLFRNRDELAHAAPPPPLPATRDADSRTGRRGAPLWQLCEFHPSLSDSQKAGLEAALEASGLLDAWITPDGTLSGPLPNDTFLAHGDRFIASAVPTLASWLVADLPAGCGITAETLAQTLHHIGAGSEHSAHWVTLDGHWQLGPIFGRGTKPMAQYLGSTSRERARLQRLAEIEVQLDELQRKEDLLHREREQLDAREAEATAESKSAPRDESVFEGLTLRTEARTKLTQATNAHAIAAQRTQDARKQAEGAQAALNRDATHLGYADHLYRLHELRPAWVGYERAITEAWGCLQAWITSRQHLEGAQSRARVDTEEHASRNAELEVAHHKQVQASQTHETLLTTSGASVIEYQSQLRNAEVAKIAANSHLEQARDFLSEAKASHAAHHAQLAPAKERISLEEGVRDRAISALRVPAIHGLFPEAHDSLADIETDAWSATRAVTIARRIDKELPEMDDSDDAWTKRLNLLDAQINDLRTSTGGACEVIDQTISQGLKAVECRYHGVTHKPTGCLAAVDNERAMRERLLGEGERDIIDRHLVTEVSMQLRTLIEGAKARTEQMNEEMVRCATTLGLTMKLVWEPKIDDLPLGLPAVRRLLLGDHANWTSAERESVGECLHQLIAVQRIANPKATAAEQLQVALDYRQWHQFYAMRRQNDKWERLTKQKYGTGSGGEKALLITIPKMAAASSHYQTAAPHAPRFILLDEAFVGLDTPTRAELMGLLEAFDLDLLMTSEREWGTHATLSGIAIYQLVANADAVAATRWVWNGKACRRAPVPDTPELRT